MISAAGKEGNMTNAGATQRTCYSETSMSAARALKKGEKNFA